MAVKRQSSLPGTEPKRARLTSIHALQHNRRSLMSNTKFANVPVRLLEFIEHVFQVREKGKSLATYTLSQGQMERYPGSSVDFLTESHTYDHVDAANTALLMALLDAEPELTNEDTANWRQLANVYPIYDVQANPGPLRLHGIRRGDIGWHFDKYGCLGICCFSERGAFYSTMEDVVNTEKQFSLECFFVKAEPRFYESAIPLVLGPPKKVSFKLKKAAEVVEDIDEDIVGKKFLAGIEDFKLERDLEADEDATQGPFRY